jgi:hypothetical protein
MFRVRLRADEAAEKFFFSSLPYIRSLSRGSYVFSCRTILKQNEKYNASTLANSSRAQERDHNTPPNN